MSLDNHRSMRPAVLLAILATFACLLTTLAMPADAAVRLVYEGSGTPLDLEQPVDLKHPLPEYAFSLPYYVVDQDAPGGLTTLFAVRNRSANSETIAVTYLDEFGIEQRRDEVLLDADETVTINLRNIPGLSVDGGVSQGTVLINLIDPATGNVQTRQVLTGDFLYVDPDNDFANGDVLVDTITGYCVNWDTRFFNGGAFNGGTDFIYQLPAGPDFSGAIAEGNVYDESGVFQGTVTLVSDGEIAGTANTADIAGELPAFGSIEWRFTDGNMGTMAVVFSAEGRYSVGASATCAD